MSNRTLLLKNALFHYISSAVLTESDHFENRFKTGFKLVFLTGMKDPMRVAAIQMTTPTAMIIFLSTTFQNFRRL
jgi:hypothetical protein